MKTLILLFLLSLIAAADAQQRPSSQEMLHRQQLRASRLPAFRQPGVVFRPQQRAPMNCGIGRWIDGVFTCQAGPVERALDRLNDTIESSNREQLMLQGAQQRAQEAQALAQAKANEKAASDAAYVRAMTPVFGPPAGLGPMPASDDGIRKTIAPNGTITFSNVR